MSFFIPPQFLVPGFVAAEGLRLLENRPTPFASAGRIVLTDGWREIPEALRNPACRSDATIRVRVPWSLRGKKADA